ncbi:exodeoxyribonuclease III [Cytophaga hutchinsonii]|jgi:exodeoxyribonuclease-3|uniref:Exodeoxyribonuclease III n=1 Tax=Cytophaga hutchinsonii (strain ATCC 33406 / DSM 1761 / CIP 103989 / NBRC 15051 / NCIMB 9469 / D465) TaxID=269798 RepID=A0A6N4SVV3_CYTH3|nr:exodeoxyribonuclease III [Cytophaga hutchinsonii]ABG60730.1 exodeoxyribonuclease III [Cytophaga hutchinsonii ATCC 33406]SFX70671.1 exodeoxyribonuclease-3 [Cytophaga hutchinsonii ATCC 33406]
MKIITYNVNGIRAAITKGLLTWVKATNADVLCFQEIKASVDQFDVESFKALGYTTYAFPAQKKGYSGVAICTKEIPVHVEYGCGIEKYDFEGRVIRADYPTFSVMNVYMPSGSSGDDRQAFKFGWMDDFLLYISEVRKKIPNLIVCGDYNICHKAIDIHNPKSNAKTSGFLPEEREWMSKFFDSGFVDAFRHFNEEPHHYTWWSYRAGSRGKNLGWRIDYHSVTQEMVGKLKRSVILPDAIHSDHCPVLLEIIP